VKQKYQRKGIGRELVKQGLEKYSKVRQKVLLTDNEESLKNFYQKIGFKEVNELHLSCFVKIS
ncbi:MAG: GNAT family N-acetyltransferase, partial [Bacteroidota bacterium]